MNFSCKNNIFLNFFFSLFVCMSLALFDSSQSESFECVFLTNQWDSIIDRIYQCAVINSVSITSLDQAQIDEITGEHKADHNDDNVEGFDVYQRGHIHYFPRGLGKIFKNLKSIQLYNIGLKTIHQSDLKDFPNLIIILFRLNNVEILEKDLFKFNPKLEVINFEFNKISHIDTNVFDKLTNLRTLYLGRNTCASIAANNNSTGVLKVIETLKTKCINPDFPLLELKIKNLEIESENLNSENLKEKLKKLEKEIKKSKFSNYFQQKLEDLKAAQTKKAHDEATTTTQAPKFETCSAIESKIDEIAANLNNCGTNSNNHQQNEQCAAIKEDLININGTMVGISQVISKAETKNEENYASLKDTMDKKLEILEENMENFKISALKEIQNIKNAVKDAHDGFMQTMNAKADKMDGKMEKLEEKLAKIVKALKIDN